MERDSKDHQGDCGDSDEIYDRGDAEDSRDSTAGGDIILPVQEIRDGSGMVDVTRKPEVHRIAIASGEIRLRPETVTAIADRLVKKGDVLTAARLAALLAVKDTPRIIPMCHSIPITAIDVDFSLEKDIVRARVRVSSIGKTGVEMEALSGVSVALLTIWDMVKSMEKDETGNYPWTSIQAIQVVEKRKGA